MSPPGAPEGGAHAAEGGAPDESDLDDDDVAMFEDGAGIDDGSE